MCYNHTLFIKYFVANTDNIGITDLLRSPLTQLGYNIKQYKSFISILDRVLDYYFQNWRIAFYKRRFRQKIEIIQTRAGTDTRISR